MEEYSIGIDIGGTKILMGIMNDKADIIHTHRIPTPKSGKDNLLRELKENLKEFLQIADNENMHIKGIGIGVAGVVSAEGMILKGANIPGWRNINLYKEISTITHLPVWIENDVNALTIGEYYVGIKEKEKDIICLSIGTGVGGGVISNHVLLKGSNGEGGELGHITVNFNGPVCKCGNKGCLETYASGNGVAERMVSLLSENNTATNHHLLDSYEINSLQVFKWYHEKLPEAVTVVEEMLSALTSVTKSLIRIFNPTTIIFAGGVITNSEWILKEIKYRLYSSNDVPNLEQVQLRTSPFKDNAGLIGAACQPWKKTTN